GAGVAVAPRSVLGLAADASNIAVHDLPDIGAIETLLVWRRGHFSSALNALKQTLLGQENVRGLGEAGRVDVADVAGDAEAHARVQADVGADVA
ncbi:MAG: LysR family transcriptional regulator, partial [Burkholderia sp.]|nr:LysR family transcriptional regulator [Burkholderia sp.]